MADLDLTNETPPPSIDVARKFDSAGLITRPYNPDETRETTRGDLARGLLWLLPFAIGGVLAFIGLGRLDGTVLTQSIFPSLIALADTALGFYFGSQTAKESAKEPDTSAATAAAKGPAGSSNTRPATASGAQQDTGRQG